MQMAYKLSLESIESWMKDGQDKFAQRYSTGPNLNAKNWVEDNIIMISTRNYSYFSK